MRLEINVRERVSEGMGVEYVSHTRIMSVEYCYANLRSQA
jgi:hypothetical protein